MLGECLSEIVSPELRRTKQSQSYKAVSAEPEIETMCTAQASQTNIVRFAESPEILGNSFSNFDYDRSTIRSSGGWKAPILMRLSRHTDARQMEDARQQALARWLVLQQSMTTTEDGTRGDEVQGEEDQQPVHYPGPPLMRLSRRRSGHGGR